MNGLNNSKPETDLDKLLQAQEEENTEEDEFDESDVEEDEYDEYDEYDAYSEDDFFDDPVYTTETVAHPDYGVKDLQRMMEEEQTLQDPEEYDKVILKKENVTYSVKTNPTQEDIQKHEMLLEKTEKVAENVMNIDGTKIPKKEKDEAETKESYQIQEGRNPQRVYRPKTTFAKPKEEIGILPKLITIACVCVAVGLFLGLQASSYYNYMDGKIRNTMSCLYSWITIDNMPFRPFPFAGDVFGTGFLTGFGISAVVALFLWLDADSKKASRVGHEHGNARLGTPKDFKSFKNRFME